MQINLIIKLRKYANENICKLGKYANQDKIQIRNSAYWDITKFRVEEPKEQLISLFSELNS